MAAEHLTIIVPYRDRARHLATFLPHLCAFFSRAVRDDGTGLDVLIVEQAAGAPFNGGLLKNIGFLLARDRASYVCFHDVDYLPIWVDYSKPGGLTPLLWYGAERRPLVPGGTRYIEHRLETFYGGVVMIPAGDFETVNGYANDYWGWGYEDLDLLGRCICAGIAIDRRKGTFHALDHHHEGFDAAGTPTATHLVNRRLYHARWPQRLSHEAIDRVRSHMDHTGLATTRYTLARHETLPRPDTDLRGIPLTLVTVDVAVPSGWSLPGVATPGRAAPDQPI